MKSKIKPMGSRRLHRRSFLRGSGVALGLPFLEAMLPRNVFSAPGDAVPERFLVVNWSLGTHEGNHNHWRNTAMAGIKSAYGTKLNFYDYLNNAHYPDPHWHTLPEAQFLTGYSIQGVRNDGGTKSVDQLIAEKISASNPVESIHLGGQYRHINHDEDFGRRVYRNLNYSNHVSWKSKSLPNYPITNPASAFTSYLASLGVPSSEQIQLSATLQRKKSILDYVLSNIKRLKADLGSEDRQKLDEYLTSFNSLERKVAASIESNGETCAVGAVPSNNLTIHEQAAANLDIIYHAFKCDLTRVATMMFTSGVGGAAPRDDQLDRRTAQYGNFGFNGGTLHAYSHQISRSNEAKNLFKRVAVENANVLKGFLDKFSTLAVDGVSPLDKSIILYGSPAGYASAHQNNAASVRLPISTIGNLGGKFKSGMHNLSLGGRQLKDLHRSFLAAYGVDVSQNAIFRTANPVTQVL